MTIREIASIINCSPSTVYRAINSPETVSQKIKDQVTELLREDNNDIIKLQQVYIVLPQMNVFYSSLLMKISNLLIPQNIRIIPFFCNESAVQEANILNNINFSSRTALIWNPIDPNSKFSFLSKKRNKPKTIILNRSHNIYNTELSISYANPEAMQMAVDILFQNGAKNILFVSSNIDSKTIRERNTSFIDSIQKNNLLSGDILHTDFFNWKTSYQQINQQKELLEKYEAIISGSEAIGYAFSKLFFNTPHLRSSLQFITFDYTPMFDILSFSMIYFPIDIIAEKIVNTLLDSPRENISQYYILPQIQLSEMNKKSHID